jgi:heptosyltransferase II
MSAPATSVPLTIAIVKPCCIGDCVMALPAIESLASAFPFAHIHAFTGRHSAAVFRASQHISRVYLTPDQLTASRVPGLAWNLRTAGHDWIVVLDRSRWVNAAARSATPPRLVSLPRSRAGLVHETDVYLAAVESVGVKPATAAPRLKPDEPARAAAANALQSLETPFAVLHPGGAENPGTSMTNKRWPVEYYAELMRHLINRGFSCVLTGSQAEAGLCRELVEQVNVAMCLNLAGKLDLMGSVAVIERATVYVGTDTGISHLAAAVGTPVVVVFGPTNPDRYAPRGDQVTILAPEGSYRLPDADLRKVRAAGDAPQTADISADAVIDAVEQLLSTGPGS